MEVEAILLGKTATGSNTQRLSLYSRESGFITAYKKTAAKLSANPQPDLFDTAFLNLDSGKQDTIYFVQNYTLKIRRGSIPKDYHCFESACRFATVLSMNGQWLEDSKRTFDLTEQAFNAFNDSEQTEIVYLKSLFKLVQQEGFPVRESWCRSFAPEPGKTLSELLGNPLEKLKKCQAETVHHFIEGLEVWIRRETSVRLPE